MLRKRLISVLTFCDGVLFRTKDFTPDYRYTLSFVDAWSIDEVVVLDVTRTDAVARPAFDAVIQQFASQCFVPLAAGGGVRTMEDVRRMMANGADKVVVNTGALERPELITEIAESYGTQCVVLSIDAKRQDGGGYRVHANCGQAPTDLTPAEWAKRGQDLGAGEIMVTSIDNDGSLEGYDLDLCREVTGAVTVPVLIAGGAGAWKHFVEGIDEGHASAACMTNIYHFTESSIRSAKTYMAKAGVLVRQ